MKKKRLDTILSDRGIFDSRSAAQRSIMAGQVIVDGQIASKPSQLFEDSVEISLKQGPQFVSRGGIKLQKALDDFGYDRIDGFVCVDVGASTGGFTDCLLGRGAKRVYAIDVGYGQLHYQLRNDHRVLVMERTNVKNVTALPENVDLVTIDASFISLKYILPVITNWPKNNILKVIALIKPQFEVGRKIAAKGKGVVRDEFERQKVIDELTAFSLNIGFHLSGLVASPILGPKGNKEYFIHLTFGDMS